MFVYNIKINGNKTFKIIFTTMLIILIILLCFVTIKIFNGAVLSSKDSSCIPQNKTSKLTATNYTNVLKTVHENIDNYVGMKINFTGYVYRVLDLNEDQFVLARDMVISSNFQSVIVGFLCESEKIKNFENNTWVEITGEITKGDYHGEMPIVKVIDIKKIDKPNEEFVYPPDESYIPTDGIL